MVPSRLQPLLAPDATPMQLAALFGAAGRDLYLVGGSVRDALMGRDGSADLDFTTDARPDEIKAIVGPWASDLWLAGETFGTVGAIRDGHKHEITTFRSEVYRDDSRKPHVEYSKDITTDLSRRDFTVNAMALKLSAQADESPTMVDPFGGLADLGAGVLRTPLDPHISFGDDPLRMLRLFRFTSQLGFTPDLDAVVAATEMHDRLAIVSAERIQVEFEKLMTGHNVGPALWGLIETGLARGFIPELPALALEQDPFHRHKDVLAHSVAVVEKTSPRLRLRLAALLHDIGKPKTRAFGPQGVTFHHHEAVGARMAKERLRALRFPKGVVADVSQLVFLHMRPHTYKLGWTDSAVRRYVRDAGDLLADLNELVRCDVTTRNEKRARQIRRRIDELEERIDELRRQEELDALRPPIDGNRVMAYLGIGPSRTVGDIMRVLYEHRIEHGPYSEEEALHLVDDWWSEHGAGSPPVSDPEARSEEATG
jgi:poly(A) polymerase